MLVSSKASRQMAILSDLWIITLKKSIYDVLAFCFIQCWLALTSKQILEFLGFSFSNLRQKLVCSKAAASYPKPSEVSGLLQKQTQSLACYKENIEIDLLLNLTWVLKTMWTPPGMTNAACSLRKSNTSWTVAENGRPLRRRQSLVFMPLMHGPGTKKGGWKGGCWGRGGNMIGGKLCKKLL